MGPDNPPSPYDAAIADVETRIRSMQMALETLKQLRASGLCEPIPTPGAISRSAETEVQHDTFFSMTIAEAARKYLTMMKATKSTADIASALEQGGLKHSSKDFPSNVRSIIGHRDDFIRVPNGDWGLVEWYPGQGRGKKAKPEKAAKVHAGKSKQARTDKASDGPTRKERIIKVMGTDTMKDWTAGEIAKVAEDNRRSVQAMLWGMVKAGDIVKADRGYRLPKIKSA